MADQARRLRRFAQRVADMKRLGFEDLRCNVRFVEGQFADAKQARKQIDETGMIFSGPHTGLGQPAEQYDRLIEGAASLGARRFAVSGANNNSIKEGKLNEELLKKKVDAVTRLASAARRPGSAWSITTTSRNSPPADWRSRPCSSARILNWSSFWWTWATPIAAGPTWSRFLPSITPASTPCICVIFATKNRCRWDKANWTMSAWPPSWARRTGRDG